MLPLGGFIVGSSFNESESLEVKGVDVSPGLSWMKFPTSTSNLSLDQFPDGVSLLKYLSSIQIIPGFVSLLYSDLLLA